MSRFDHRDRRAGRALPMICRPLHRHRWRPAATAACASEWPPRWHEQAFLFVLEGWRRYVRGLSPDEAAKQAARDDDATRW